MADVDDEVALFIDFENLYTSARTKLNVQDVDWQVLISAIEKFGRVVIQRAYSNWGDYARHIAPLSRYAIETINTAGIHKSVSDTHLVVDAMDVLATRPNIKTYIIVSGDSDFTILAQRLRSHQKRVIGVGIHGTTAAGLIQACDEYVFYDELLSPDVLKKQQQARQNARSGKANKRADKDQSIKRDILTKDLRGTLSPGYWVAQDVLAKRLRKRNKNFENDLKSAGYNSLEDLLGDFPDQIEMRVNEKNQTEVFRPGKKGSTSSVAAPASPPPQPIALSIEDYLKVLRKQRIYMTPNRHRPDIIISIYRLAQREHPATLTQLMHIVQKAYEGHPDVAATMVKEVIHQLFHAYSFEFEKEDGVMLWDCPSRFIPEINSERALLRNCDRDILRRIYRGLSSRAEIDPKIAANILYGRDDHPAFAKRAEQLLDEIKHEK